MEVSYDYRFLSSDYDFGLLEEKKLLEMCYFIMIGLMRDLLLGLLQYVVFAPTIMIQIRPKLFSNVKTTDLNNAKDYIPFRRITCQKKKNAQIVKYARLPFPTNAKQKTHAISHADKHVQFHAGILFGARLPIWKV
ncbi:hypothetical protein Ahy_B03g062422 [Arachis hypogaea]|uniref:Uncharacterized protein n=1 Tax=Arachis hypogaea TaxID=3818 RepID=A0A444ZU15_ARAHY|nr:hypothetical protein Ahy_B03g062422 [Arachis hypogaea]